MKFTYAYKTSDGVRHEAAMDAESREQVFVALREKGIKAIKVVAADGSKANGEVRGIRKRVLAVSVIAAAVLAGIAVYFLNSRILRRDNFGQTEFVTSQTRRQVIGDAAIIEKGIRTGWAEVFELEGERFLASFAIPGVPAGQRSTTVEEIQKALDAPNWREVSDTPRQLPPNWREVSDTPRQLPPNWREVSDTPRQLPPSNSLEARQIRAMVEGMKDEARRFLKAGGSIAQYGRLLVQRQEEEIAYYNRAKAEIEAAQKANMPAELLNDLWERRNESLRQMGVKLVPLPE